MGSRQRMYLKDEAEQHGHCRWCKHCLARYEFCYNTTTETKSKRVDPKWIWIGDTGASAHMSNVWEGFFDVQEDKGKTNFAGDGHHANTTHSGQWRGRMHNVGKEQKQLNKGEKITLDHVLYVPNLRHNLFSITKAMKDGGKISNDGDIIQLVKDNMKIRFDYKLRTKNGHVMAAIIKPLGILNEDEGEGKIRMNINDYHNRTYQSETYIKATADRLNIKLTGKFDLKK